jgi:hypothetical protein
MELQQRLAALLFAALQKHKVQQPAVPALQKHKVQQPAVYCTAETQSATDRKRNWNTFISIVRPAGRQTPKYKSNYFSSFSSS